MIIIIRPFHLEKCIFLKVNLNLNKNRYLNIKTNNLLVRCGTIYWTNAVFSMSSFVQRLCIRVVKNQKNWHCSRSSFHFVRLSMQIINILKIFFGKYWCLELPQRGHSFLIWPILNYTLRRWREIQNVFSYNILYPLWPILNCDNLNINTF